VSPKKETCKLVQWNTYRLVDINREVVVTVAMVTDVLLVQILKLNTLFLINALTPQQK